VIGTTADTPVERATICEVVPGTTPATMIAAGIGTTIATTIAPVITKIAILREHTTAMRVVAMMITEGDLRMEDHTIGNADMDTTTGIGTTVVIATARGHPEVCSRYLF